MYQAYKCLRCGHTFDMTDEARKAFCKAGGSVIRCPECGCVGLDELDLGKHCAGCINPETGRFLSCVDCTFEPSKYNCNAFRQEYRKYQIITMYIKETSWNKKRDDIPYVPKGATEEEAARIYEMIDNLW